MITRRVLISSLTAVVSALTATRSLAARWLSSSSAETAQKLTEELRGRIFFPTDANYEELRRSSIWNARKPARYPRAIVMAESEADVVAAVGLAKAKGWQVGVRSGGHSWVAPHTRGGAVLINLSKMQDMVIDSAARTAAVSPAVQGQVLGKALRERQLMFPSGHCFGVGLGGYVLCGGHGWNSRLWGPACANLTALDVVTANGDVIHANKHQNPDYYWAARGAGPGFFGVATRFYLTVHQLPSVMKSSRFVFSADVLEELLTWARDNVNRFPKILEVLISASAPNNVPELHLSAVALGYSEEEVDAALALVENSPFSSKALSKSTRNRIVVPGETESPTAQEPRGYRFALDNMWTNAPAKDLVPMVREALGQLPTPLSYIFIQCWGPIQRLDDMAYSVQGEIYITYGAVYQDPADDARCDAWVTGSMRRYEHLSVGSMMNDENMIGRKSRYLSETASRRLTAMQARHDPHGLFVSFLESET